MKNHRLLVAGLVLLPLWSIAADAPPSPPSAPATPRLAVVIAIDQFRADYLVRFRPYFGAGGFKRLLEGGADYRNSFFRHAVTVTAPGHATILSGVHANIHGVTANDWLDRDAWEPVNNVEDRDSPLVGLPDHIPLPLLRAPKGGRSPKNFQATTVGDQLKLRFGADSKVFAASNKDRSAILLGGKLADGAYWDESGAFVTSRYYRDKLPDWVAEFNAEHRSEKAFGSTWERLLAPAIYDAVQGPDDDAGESVENGLTRTFPKKFDGGTAAISPNFYTALENAPITSVILGDFVQRAIREEKLGRHRATDLLCVSFSQLDAVGHSYGPDSHEVMDAVLRLDRVIADLLDCLDREVGLANCIIVFTADHGASPLPERVRALRPAIPAGRVDVAELNAFAKHALDTTFGMLPRDEYWFVREGMGYHLNPRALAGKKIRTDDAGRVLQAAMRTHPAIAQVYTRAEILAASAEGDSLLAAVRRSYYEPRDRDVVMILKPYFMDRLPAGTTHGTPYDYDQHVPQLWYGTGIIPGVHLERVGVDDIAPTLSALLNIPRPPQAQGKQLF
jgi:predicted AlkP superfamily pyrophosphatase or phosphodiesterase